MTLPVADDCELCDSCGGCCKQRHSQMHYGGARCTCPAGVRYLSPVRDTAPKLDTLRDQIMALLPHIPEHKRVTFLAGVRFAEGFHEYGRGLFDIDAARLDYEHLCEKADVEVFDYEKARRDG